MRGVERVDEKVEGAEAEEGRSGKDGEERSNRGERPEDKRMDRMWQWRDTRLQDCERCVEGRANYCLSPWWGNGVCVRVCCSHSYKIYIPPTVILEER